MNASLMASIEARREKADAAAVITQVISDGGALSWQGAEESSIVSGFERRYVDKSPCGFTGLLNQGATCYLNSFLQTLYMSPEFREAIYNWRFDASRDGSPEFSIAFQLQNLFARLQLSAEAAVPTGALTKSFGWAHSDVFQQHDVQELFHVLFENLERSCLESDLGRTLNFLFRGHTLDYVYCQTCKNLRTKSDEFVDVSLAVEGCRDVQDSFDAFVKPDVLEGPNKYNCSVCASKQPALKARVKINTPLRFPRFLDVSPFQIDSQAKFDPTQWVSDRKVNDAPGSNPALSSVSEQSSLKPLKYELFSVLMHTGSALGGHYFTYTKDWLSGRWFRFDDAHVTELAEEDVKTMFMTVQEKEEWEKRVFSDVPKLSTVDANSTNTPPAAPPVAPPAAPPVAPASLAPTVASTVPSVSAPAENSYIMHLRAQVEQNSLTMLQQEKHGFIDPAVNAYMLMYRLVDETKNVNEVPLAFVPAERVQEITKANAEYQTSKAEYERLRSLLRLRVHCLDAELKIEIPKNHTLSDLAVESFKSANLAARGLRLEHVRLREFDLARKVALRPYSTEELSTTLEILGLENFKHFFLEVRDPDRAFEEYQVPLLHLKLIEFEPSTGSYSPSIEFFVPETDKARDLRAQVARILESFGQLPPEHVRLVLLRSDVAEVILDDDKLLQRDYQLTAGTTVYCERVCPPADHFSKGECRLVEKFLEQQALITVYFNGFDPLPSEPVRPEGAPIDASAPPVFRSSLVHSSIDNPPDSSDHLTGTLIGASGSSFNHSAPLAPLTIFDTIPKAPSVTTSVVIPPAPSVPPAPVVIPSDVCVSDVVPVPPAVPVEPKERSPVYPYNSVFVDGRRTIGVLKQAIADFVGIPVDQFKIKSSQFGSEFKDPEAKLITSMIRSGDSVWIERGVPMEKGQRLFKVFLQIAQEHTPERLLATDKDDPYSTALLIADSHSSRPSSAVISPTPSPSSSASSGSLCSSAVPSAPEITIPISSAIPQPPPAPPTPTETLPTAESVDPNAESNFEFVGDIVLQQAWSMMQVKEAIAAAFGDKVPPPALMRVREKLGRQKVYVDNRTLRANAIGDKDGKEIFLQRTHSEEHMTDQHILLFCRQWLPSLRKYGPVKEIAFLKTMTIEAFKIYLSETNSIPLEHLRVSKVRQYQLVDVAAISELDWFGTKLRPTSTLGGYPWACQDGDYVLFKDNRQPEVRAEHHKIAIPGHLQSHSREVGIVFRTPQELAELERLRKADDEQRRAEAEAARQEMQERAKALGLTKTPEELAADKKKKDELEAARQEAIERVTVGLRPTAALKAFIPPPVSDPSSSAPPTSSSATAP